MPDIAVVPEYLPDDIHVGHADPLEIRNPFNEIWWATGQTIAGIPQAALGWLVAQGWKITGTAPDLTTVPPTISYTLVKDQLEPLQVLLSLCNSWTREAHNAREANKIRYNDIISDWKDMLTSSQAQFDAQVERQNSDLGIYITDLGTLVDDITNRFDQISRGLSSDYQTHKDAAEEVLVDIDVDYDAHKTTAEGFLTNLGTTEVARITEQFASTLSVQLQKLIDDGLYTSAVDADITARNIRDRDEQLQKHYDSLAREQLTNEHRLWEQDVQLNVQMLPGQKLDNTHRLWDQNVQLANFANQAITAELNAKVAGLQGWKDVAAENQRLMAYQLDERNKLLIGLYSFVERREDVAPSWQEMSQMIAGLGDSAGGWITP